MAIWLLLRSEMSYCREQNGVSFQNRRKVAVRRLLLTPGLPAFPVDGVKQQTLELAQDSPSSMIGMIGMPVKVWLDLLRRDREMQMLTLSCNLDSGEDQWQDGGNDPQDAPECWAKGGTEGGNGLRDWLLITTRKGSLALVARGSVVTAFYDLDSGSSEVGSGEGEDGDDFGELHVADLANLNN